ncbi:MAG TPA: hypothetical protein ENL03_02210, partial [Phycisphaerae bacterium]|nr:hypothetical protein [Phycisphaerae bacterium]
MKSHAIKLMFSCIVLALAALACSLDVIADDTATNGWRGDGSGSFPKAKVVTKWSPDENII